jgi:hypothetical protein
MCQKTINIDTISKREMNVPSEYESPRIQICLFAYMMEVIESMDNIYFMDEFRLWVFKFIYLTHSYSEPPETPKRYLLLRQAEGISNILIKSCVEKDA